MLSCQGAAIGRAHQRIGPYINAEHRGSDRAAQKVSRDDYSGGVSQCEANPAHRRRRVPPRRRCGGRGAGPHPSLTGPAPHGPPLLGTQYLNLSFF